MTSAAASQSTKVSHYVETVTKLAGDQLRSITEFGDFANKSEQLIRTVVVLAKDDLEFVRALAKTGAKLKSEGMAAPLIMTAVSIEASRDTFPLELMEIAQCHQVVMGEDFFSQLNFSREHVRLQCERELKAMAIALRQRVLREGGDEKKLLLNDLAEGVVRILRGVLRLKGEPPQRLPAEVIAAASKCLNRSLEVITSARNASPSWTNYCAFYAEIQSLGSMVDGW